MIEPAELHKYFAVREIATGQTVRLTGAHDIRYELTGTGLGEYRASPAGNYFLAESVVYTHPWHRTMRLDEVEPLPGGEGLYHPSHLDAYELSFAMTYKGSWREYADSAARAGDPGDTDCGLLDEDGGS